jgi:lipase chaperone LimK
MSYLTEDVDVVTKLMKEMQAFSNEHQLDLHYLNFYQQLVQFNSELDKIVASAKNVIAENSYKNIHKERRKILKFLARVINSEIFTQYCKYKTL